MVTCHGAGLSCAGEPGASLQVATFRPVKGHKKLPLIPQLITRTYFNRATSSRRRRRRPSLHLFEPPLAGHELNLLHQLANELQVLNVPHGHLLDVDMLELLLCGHHVVVQIETPLQLFVLLDLLQELFA